MNKTTDAPSTRGVKAWAGWLPTAENINALPEPVRKYIVQIETLCDPAGMVREIAQLKDTLAGLQIMYRRAVDAGAPVVDAPSLPARVLAMCKARGWSLHWTHRGAYLHLESSELIEALRGKRGDPLGEAADVLLVLMSITESNGLPWDAVLAQCVRTVENLEAAPRYKGEEFSGAAAGVTVGHSQSFCAGETNDK